MLPSGNHVAIAQNCVRCEQTAWNGDASVPGEADSPRAKRHVTNLEVAAQAACANHKNNEVTRKELETGGANTVKNRCTAPAMLGPEPDTAVTSPMLACAQGTAASRSSRSAGRSGRARSSWLIVTQTLDA